MNSLFVDEVRLQLLLLIVLSFAEKHEWEGEKILANPIEMIDTPVEALPTFKSSRVESSEKVDEETSARCGKKERKSLKLFS